MYNREGLALLAMRSGMCLSGPAGLGARALDPSVQGHQKNGVQTERAGYMLPIVISRRDRMGEPFWRVMGKEQRHFDTAEKGEAGEGDRIGSQLLGP